MKATCFQQIVWNKCKCIPSGRVSTYSEIARAAGSTRAVPVVGNALNKNHNAKVPCHRVVRSDGCVGGYNSGAAAKVVELRR